jgi:alkanesulfonate monooxygenase SsuD/methylene tetrahydromethanopterin reductase-like flavin-dependent oxidoreductase (luciferase family)
LDVYVMTNAMDDGPTLAEKVRTWEEIGLTGVLVPDHLFISRGGRRTRQVLPDPFVVLPAVGAFSSSLQLGTIVANCSIVHPAWVLRHLAHLALLFGGSRVIAGLGAGWNSEEFDALGMTMPCHAERATRLEETLKLAKQLFIEGCANVSGESFTARNLPMSTGTGQAPRILIGGGSDRLLELAAKYADHLDLNGWPGGKKLGREGAPRQDGVRRLTTTVDNLEASVRRLRELLELAGREPESLRCSVLVDTVDVCDQTDVAKRRSAVAEARGTDASWVGTCPYVLVGPPTQLAEALAERVERLALSALIVPEGPNLEVLMTEVIPLISPR